MRTMTVALCACAMFSGSAFSQVVTELGTEQKVIALTFDACETVTPSYFDEPILDYLLANELPVTLFVSGKFAERNKKRLQELSQNELVDFGNHSWSHYQDMPTLDPDSAVAEVRKAGELLKQITGREMRYFRFPAGNYDQQTLELVEDLGYTVVHWTFESGDPDTSVSPADLTDWVLYKTRPASILIFHINRRGYSTAEALPQIVGALKAQGYQFVKLSDRVD